MFDNVSVGDRVYLPGRHCLADVVSIYTTNGGKSRYQIEVICLPAMTTVSYARRMWLAYDYLSPNAPPAFKQQGLVAPRTPPKAPPTPLAAPYVGAPAVANKKKREAPQQVVSVSLPNLPVKPRPLSDFWGGFYVDSEGAASIR